MTSRESVSLIPHQLFETRNKTFCEISRNNTNIISTFNNRDFNRDFLHLNLNHFFFFFGKNWE